MIIYLDDENTPMGESESAREDGSEEKGSGCCKDGECQCG